MSNVIWTKEKLAFIKGLSYRKHLMLSPSDYPISLELLGEEYVYNWETVDGFSVCDLTEKGIKKAQELKQGGLI